jgi:6-phosphogluconolactonase
MTVLDVRHFPTRAALDDALTERLARALAAHDPAAVMLAGGTTPLPAYRALSSRPLSHAERLCVLFSDERYVACDSPASNYHQARPLLRALALSADRVLRVRTELPLEEAADDYARQLEALLSSGVPLGLGLLGLGADGHTASLFSHADLERARGRLAVAVQRPDGMSAVSVTPDLLARVSEPLFVVAAAGKQVAVSALTAQDPELVAWRAVQGCPRVELWLHDGHTS